MNSQEIGETRLPFFVQDQIAILIGNSNYKQYIQKNRENCDDLKNVPQSHECIYKMRNLLEHYGFKDENIVTLMNSDSKTVKATFQEMADKIFKSQKKTVIFCYYIGHGVENNSFNILFNSTDPGTQYFELER